MPVKILVVDDDETFRDLITLVLERANRLDVQSVFQAHDGVEAVEMVRSERPELVIMDLMMPRLDGLQASRLIKQEWPDTRVIVVTSLADPEYEKAAYVSNADAFVDKGSLLSSLANTLLQLIVEPRRPDRPPDAPPMSSAL